MASYNIHRAVGTDRRRDLGRIGAVLGELQADIIGLQEVDWQRNGDGGEGQVTYLAHIPGYQAVAGPNVCDHHGEYGNLLLTRITIDRVCRLDLTQRGREPRGAIDVDLAITGRPLRIIVTHFGLGIGERWRQASQLGSSLHDRFDQPTIVLGDLNEWLPGSPTLRPLIRVCASAKCAASFPASRPFLALDRILAHGLPPPSLFRAHRSPLARQASDHLPVIAEIDLP